MVEEPAAGRCGGTLQFHLTVLAAKAAAENCPGMPEAAGDM